MKQNILTRACVALFFFATFYCGSNLQAQVGYYTLTNGRLWWSNGLQSQPDEDWMDPVAFDKARGWAHVHPHGDDHVTHITVQGDTYLALDITTDPAHPRVATKAHGEFDRYCVWYRDADNKYSQEWYNETDGKTYIYYLVGSSENGLEIAWAEKEMPVSRSTNWNAWDFGAAVQETPLVNGNLTNRYYWIMLDTLDEANNNGRLANPVWLLSGDSYQRPDDIIYLRYDDPDTVVTNAADVAAGLGGKNINRRRYYDDVEPSFGLNEDTIHHPAGIGALFMPVRVIAHEDTVIAVDTDPVGGEAYGLQKTTTGTGIALGATTLEYNSTTPATTTIEALIHFGAGYSVPMTVRQQYTEYIEETYRRGIHLDYGSRTEEGVFGSKGQGTFSNHYFWGDDLHDALPGLSHENATVDTIIFSVDNRSRRYVKVTPIASMSTHPTGTTLTFDVPVNGTHVAQIYLMVRYSNGTVQRDTATLTLHYDKPVVTPEPLNGPVVRGAVFGGGRMANVGGNTLVVVHSADSINTVYGGNDIAGWVQGDDGATLQIGTEFTTEEHPVHIGSVYGGGNGYYTYQGINAGYNEDFPDHHHHINPYYWHVWNTDLKKGTSLIYQSYYFNGKVYPWNTLPTGYLASAEEADRINNDHTAWAGLTPVVDHEFDYTPVYIGRPDLVDQEEKGNDGDGTIPYIKTAHINVGVPEGTTPFLTANNHPTHKHNDHVLIDTLFGGARNAFIGVTSNESSNPQNGVTIDINGGTIYAVFGGNNVGGSVANTSTVFVNVHDTKLIDANEEIGESFLSGYGREFGIRYLYGGGNLVDGSHANLAITGGMIDTAYLGGNNASVATPVGLIACNRGADNEWGYSGHFICTNPTYPDNRQFTSPLQKYKDNPSFFDNYGPGHFEPENGKYNIRCLFGGNNAADMPNLTQILLHSGGISSVYGGGNVGDMTNETAFAPGSVWDYLLKLSLDVNPLTGDMKPGGWADVYGKTTIPAKIGTIVAALHSSSIVCDYVYGGSRMGNIKNSCGVYLAGGIYGYINGGNDVSGDVGSETGGGTYVVLDSNVLVIGDAMAGSDGFYHCDDGTGHYDDTELIDSYADNGDPISYDPYNDYEGMLFPSHNNVNLYMRGGLVLGQIIGGGVHADVGFPSPAGLIKKLDTDRTSPTYGTRVETTFSPLGGERRGSVHMMAAGGRVLGNAFGGGYQSKIHGLAYLTLKDSAIIDGSFFCGNDCTGSIMNFGAYINPNDLDLTSAVTAQDTADAYETAYRAMVASDGTPLNYLDGSWNANFSSYLRIKDSVRVNSVYGSGNGAYNYNGDRPEYESVSFCHDPSGSLPLPMQQSTFIDINTSGGRIDTVFGGGNGVGVSTSVLVLLNNTEPDVHSVHTIFGGNNRDNMDNVVPEINLLKGIVDTVYGGSNNGQMGFKKKFVDVAGDTVYDVSTHVVVNSDEVTVQGAIFGGCRMSDVKGTSFVEVLKTNATGVNYIYGGNDISGSIQGIARVDVSGGQVNNIFGGSNGNYDYVEISGGRYNVYPFGFVDRHPSDYATFTDSVIAVASRPDVDSTNVNIWGGIIDNSVYGGGAMADCRATCVDIDDRHTQINGVYPDAEIHGTVFGGGMGDWQNLNKRDLQGNRYGNVTEATHVHLRHAETVSNASAYGGGRGGDVANTYITTHDTWELTFDNLYGGCWGSDVFNTAHVVIDGKDFGSGKYNVKNLFGGNDFTGNVYKTDVTVNSGRYFNIYGAGNGDYAASSYNSGVYAGAANQLTRPNAEYVTLTFNDGNVDSNLYGGGKMGTTFTYQKNAAGEYVEDAYDHKIPDTTRVYTDSHSDPTDYSYVITNIHGGTFMNDIFAGARGSKDDKRPLVYGLKVLNMDGGYVYESVYGGSEAVNDGYPHECVDAATTTKRPSSILNITGATIESNLYGAGYLGLTYGSVYVNLGPDAIDSCVAYSSAYNVGGVGSADSAYWIFKPGEEGSLSPALSTDDLLVNHSIYVGPNWGSSHGNADFTNPGFYGGESKVRIDGLGYNTNNDELNNLPPMNIAKSIFCSGTSVAGGDIANSKNVDIWNYGAMVNCQPTRKLESVQRSDYLWFHNSAIEITGATDGTSAYQSIPYSLANVTSVNYRGYNVIMYDATVANIMELNFFNEDLSPSNGEPVETDLASLNTAAMFSAVPDACNVDASVCDKVDIINPEDADRQHTLMIINNGVPFTIGENSTGVYDYGKVNGFGYVASPAGYSSTIIGAKYGESTGGVGGFVSPCNTDNQWTDLSDVNAAGDSWTDYASCSASQLADAQYPFEKQLGQGGEEDYRVWRVGKGIRRVETTILAHTDPTKLTQDVSIFTHGNKQMAIAEATLPLPATQGGHYYKVVSGINLFGENETVNLIDTAFLPAQNFAALGAYYNADGSVDPVPPATDNPYGVFLGTQMATGGVAQGLNEIVNHPTSTFGLLMTPGENFQHWSAASEYYLPSEMDAIFDMPEPSIERIKSLFVVSGNSHVTSINEYYSPKVVDGTNVQPVIKFYLTYNTEFTSAFLGTVSYTLMEYDENGNEVAPVEVRVYISTIIEQFKDMNTNVLAMYNAGRTNTFTRRVVLPATLEEDRQLFLKELRWVPTDGNGNDLVSSNNFRLTGTEASIVDAPRAPDVTEDVINLFGLSIIPSDNLSSEVSNAIGWSRIDRDTLNLFDLNPALTGPSRYSDSTATETPRSIDFTGGGATEGISIGVLDGRGTAVLNVQLLFDGSRKYKKIDGLGYIGKAELTLESRLNGVPQEFMLTIYVKTRESGDTIYIASNEYVTRGGQTVRPYYMNADYNNMINSSDPDERASAAAMIGKFPNTYVRTFQQALSSTIYQEGDVLCILDTVKINEGVGVTINGGDGNPIEVLRYDGHHAQLPGESSVYRNGPMIQISGANNSFVASNIIFHGSAGGHIKANASAPRVPDTNRVFAPIFQVMNNGSLVLKNDSRVEHNYNAYGALYASQRDDDGLPLYTRNMGAINLTSGGTLEFQNNVTIAHNLCYTYEGDDKTNISDYDPLRPFNGAVYIDGGRMILSEANKATSINITQNWLKTGDGEWWETKYVNGVPIRYSFDETKVTTWPTANVFLTREQATSGNAQLYDSQSDVITINGAIAPGTRIGVRKWFDGETIRDTIRFAVGGGNDLTVLSKAYQNGNFLSDDDNNIFYNVRVNNQNIYFFRCASFRHQKTSYDLPLTRPNGTGIRGENVLKYLHDDLVSCPNGSDTLLYKVQGGFLPYTFTWSGDVDEVHTSPYPNTVVQNGINHGDTSYYWATLTDTLLTPRVDMPHNVKTHVANLRVTAVDATGECRLYKDIKVTLHKVGDVNDIPGDHRKVQTVLMGDTNRTHLAEVNRYYKAVQITPYVWVDRTQGTISAVVGSDHLVYKEYGDEHHGLDTLLLCEGDVLQLKTTPSVSSNHFIMWDFDPFNSNPATYVVPPHDASVTAYYGPNDYWKDNITSEALAGVAHDTHYDYTTRPTVPGYTSTDGTGSKAGMVVTYSGDIHIYDENGLAWFISVVNGLNGAQARPMYFNRVYLHEKADGTPYDMKDHLWSPVGSLQYGFRGVFRAVSAADADIAPLAEGTYVSVKNIIVDESAMQSTGFFSNLDEASVNGLALERAMIRGGQYVGTLAGQSQKSVFNNVAIDRADINQITTILSTHHTSGGLVGLSEGDRVTNSEVGAKYVGDAVYSGGLFGHAVNSTLINNVVRNDVRMNGLYVGGVVALFEGDTNGSSNEWPTNNEDPTGGNTGGNGGNTGGSGSLGSVYAHMANNYVQIVSNGRPQHIGGLVGRTSNSYIENNYAYGDMSSAVDGAGLATVMDANAHARRNYYARRDAKQAVSSTNGSAVLYDNRSFAGSGNQVTLSEPVQGVDNLTRVLNIWVSEKNATGGHYKLWRSDFGQSNHGYPVFGTPDLIPVSDSIILEGCEEVVWKGRVYTRNEVLCTHVVDPVHMVDSMLTTIIRIHHSQHVQITDSAVYGQDYSGYGFEVPAAGTSLVRRTLDSTGYATLVLSDTLTTRFGCDSVVTLTLVFKLGNPSSEDIDDVVFDNEIKVYPNPTSGIVHVEAEGMTRVEIYDNEGRLRRNQGSYGKAKVTLDLTNYAAGVYYVRVHTPSEVTIQKVIKR